MRMLHHGFKWHQLEDGANGILFVRHTVAEDPHGLFQLCWISMLKACVSDLWPVEDAPESLFRNAHILSRRAGQRKEGKPSRKETLCKHTNRDVIHERAERTHL